MRLEKILAERVAAGADVVPQALPTGFGGVWRNQHDSTMDLTVDGNKLAGVYTSIVNVAGEKKEVKGDITGFWSDDIISIAVAWRLSVVSMTTWVGQVVERNNRDEIDTLWHLIHNTPEADEPKQSWAAVMTGADVFHR